MQLSFGSAVVREKKTEKPKITAIQGLRWIHILNGIFGIFPFSSNNVYKLNAKLPLNPWSDFRGIFVHIISNNFFLNIEKFDKFTGRTIDQ